FSVIAIEVTAGDAPEVYSLSPGLPDQAFKHDGQLTKRIVRAATLSALAPFPGEMLWDVGAGCGSISIEWMRAARGTHAIAVESDAKRRELIDFNAQRLGVPQLRIEAGRAPETLTNLPAPQAIFIGGGASDPAIFERCWDAMMGGGRLVVNAVTLEGEQQLNMRHNELGGELNRISVESPSAQGRFRMMQPARTVTQLALVKQR
ncbi:MAG: precorrin-6Y C5,15-methyltransferase (decarboxylating) subunit CbiT, partial [Chromatiales bacterium]|nr:precorrin-6Y C5,15-methyltransferase (decarboxylating) subunit CbiT [Chromatiales bacterium]